MTAPATPSAALDQTVAAPTAAPAPGTAPELQAVPASGDARRAALDRSLLRGVMWTSVVKWGSQILTWSSTIVVARALGPDAYGLIGMSTMYLAFVTLLSEFGIGSAVVTLRRLSDDQVAQINTVAASFGLTGMLLTGAAAYPLGLLFKTPQLPAIVLALSPTLLLGTLQTVPNALLQRDMRFKLLAFIEGGQSIAVAITTVVLALLGFGVWTLVLGQLVGAALLTALLLTARRHRFARPSRARLGEALTFSGHVIGARLAWYVFNNADFFVVGRFLGKTALGAYSFGWTLAYVPIEKVTSMVVRVTPSVLAHASEDQAAVRRYLLLLSEAISVVTFPATIGLALVAGPLVLTLLGPSWAPTIVPLRLLAAYAAVRSVSPLVPQLLTALADTRFVMRSTVTAAIALPIAFLVGSRWGAAGVAVAWILVHPVVMLVPQYHRTFRLIELPARRYFTALWPAVSGCAVMTVLVLAADRLLGPGTRPGVRLVILVSTGAIAYAGSMAVLHRSRVLALRDAVRRLRAA